MFLTLPTLTPATDPLLILRPRRRPAHWEGGASAGSAWPLAEAAAAAAAVAAWRWRPGRSRAGGSRRGEGARRRRPTWGLGARALIRRFCSFSRTVLNCYGFFKILFVKSPVFPGGHGRVVGVYDDVVGLVQPPEARAGEGGGGLGGPGRENRFFLKKW